MATLNCTELDQFDAQDALPEGEYVAAITTSKVAPSKSDPASEMITLEASIIDGKYKGRKLFLRFNTKNKSKQAQDIGRAQFKQLRTALGRPNPRDTIELHNIPFRVYLKCKQGLQGMENVVSKYMPANKGPAPAAQVAAQTSTAPWARTTNCTAVTPSPSPAGGDGAALTDGVPWADMAQQAALAPATDPVPF